MAQIPGTNIIAPVVPFDSSDVHPTHEALYGRGGWRTVATTAERDAIPMTRREEGMVVVVTADGKRWVLEADLTSWVEMATGGGGGGSTAWGDITGKPTTVSGFGITDAVTTADSRLTDAREWTATTISQAEAEAGTATTRRAWTAERVRQAIVAWWTALSVPISKITGLQDSLDAKIELPVDHSAGGVVLVSDPVAANQASGNQSTVLGGSFNSSEGVASAVVAGSSNDAVGVASVVVAGGSNVANGDYSVVAGGQANAAHADASFVGCGIGSTVLGDDTGAHVLGSGIVTDRPYATFVNSLVIQDDDELSFGGIEFPDATQQTTAFTSTLKTKLDGIAENATANATDAQLRDRSTHTGTQAAGTITGLAAVATSGSAADLTTGTLPAARLPGAPVYLQQTTPPGTGWVWFQTNGSGDVVDIITG